LQLSTEELGDIDDVTPRALAQILDDDSFGTFVVLLATEDAFIQAASNWSPSAECEAFVEENGSDPWSLEYRDGSTGKIFRARGDVSLERVKAAFLQYLGHDAAWRRDYEWQEVELTG
jgi:hypothetical protein